MAEDNVAVWLSHDTSEKFTTAVLDSYKTSCQICIHADWQVKLNTCLLYNSTKI